MPELLSGVWGESPAANDFGVFQIKMELSKQLKSATLFCFTSIIQVIALLKLVFHPDSLTLGKGFKGSGRSIETMASLNLT